MFLAGWAVILSTMAYLCALFAIAHFGDTWGQRFVGNRGRGAIYALCLGVYCTSWTFFGSVGYASLKGVEFLPIYIGPMIVIGLAYPFVLRIVRLAKAQNITSIADFLGSRYGKSEPVAAMVALISVVGAVPYIALQLKAVSASLSTVLASVEAGRTVSVYSTSEISILVAAVLAAFAIAFGTRRVDATEHQDGLMLAIAAESVVKLVAFLAIGAFVTWGMFDGLGDLTARAVSNPRIEAILSRPPDMTLLSTMTALAACSILLLPRQFHVTIVENRDERDVKTAAWVFPLYLLAINLFVIPLAVAGLLTFSDNQIDRDMTVLALPLEAKSGLMTLITLVGGLSAATAMVVVESVALSIMVSNDLIMPLLLHIRRWRAQIEKGDIGTLILIVRRVSIVAMLVLAYGYYRVSGEAALAAIGLLSFACVAQIVPAFLGGLFWGHGTARGAIAGMITGVLFWAYTLLIPSLDLAALGLEQLVKAGPLGISFLRPTALFGSDMSPLVHGVIWSMTANVLTYVGFSLTRKATPIERLQAGVFAETRSTPMAQSFRLWRTSVTVGELETTVSRYIGADRTRRSINSFLTSRGIDKNPDDEADIHLIRFAEYLLASAIGAASSRLVLSLLLRRRNVSSTAALRLVDEASAAIQYNRDLLQHAIDFARQGITVFDRDLRMICWNREFRDLLELPSEMMRVGTGLDEIIRFNAKRGLYGDGTTEDHIATRMESLINDTEPFRLRLFPSHNVVEIRSARMPDGGIVTTYTDITAQVKAEEVLEATNETLEKRVRERTEELVRLNGALALAKAEADEANLSKTRFLAAASHDILQPLNAARLYATSLSEQMNGEAQVSHLEPVSLARNVDASLEAVEEILTALLDISRLDAGAMKPELSNFRLSDILDQLRIEYEPMAREKKLELTFVPTKLNVHSDRRLLRRLLQNFVSNGIKYTASGKVLVGVRRHGDSLSVQVWDTGMGIPESKQRAVFREFERLDNAARAARGLGLGLSIVERLSRVLEHKITLQSTVGKGTMFAVDVPIAVAPPQVEVVDAEQAPSMQHQPLSGLIVLAIDNEPRILEGMKSLLTGWGSLFIGRATPAAAIAAMEVKGLRPDVLIADYHLDDGDGLTAIENLRDHWGGSLPAILITADRSPDMRERAAREDVRVLNKPLKPAALRALLAQWRLAKEAEALSGE